LRAGVDPVAAMVAAGWSPLDAAGMAPHIVEFLAKSGYDVAPVRIPALPVAPAEPAGQPAPVVTVADTETERRVVTATPIVPPRRKPGRPAKGR